MKWEISFVDSVFITPLTYGSPKLNLRRKRFEENVFLFSFILMTKIKDIYLKYLIFIL